jgi:hypothetical protein
MTGKHLVPCKYCGGGMFMDVDINYRLGITFVAEKCLLCSRTRNEQTLPGTKHTFIPVKSWNNQTIRSI